jgi:cytochrome c oxidase subunit III
MATTIQPPKIDKPRDAGPKLSNSGNGGSRNLVPAGGDLRNVKNYSPPPSSTGIWVVLASITMSFLAFTSALIVRRGGAPDWHHLSLPLILYFDTVVLLASSFALQRARRQVGEYLRSARHAVAKPTTWLYTSLGLGVLFVTGQYVAWLQLRAQGLFLNTNPNASFFYVLTAVHALHVLGGLGGLARVISRFNRSVLSTSTLDATAYYWHFVDVLWLYLLALLWMKI